jgi:feruloyl esterase
MGAMMRLSGLVLLVCAVVASPDLAAHEPSCTAQSVRAVVHPPLHIEGAVHVRGSSAEPAYCRITGFIEHGTRIGIEFALPDAWNKKILFLGRGGFAGAVERPTIPSDLPVVYGAIRGYATGTTDTGHQSATVEDATWASNSAAVINHFEVGVELAANALKAIAAAYYEAVPQYAYFQGCSGGGRQGLVEAERFPDTFDGVIVGAPAWNYIHLFLDLAERAKRVIEQPEAWIPPGTLQAIDRLVMQQCDRLDGLEDGIVMDPRVCHPDLAALACKTGRDGGRCLTSAQESLLEQLLHARYATAGSGYFGLRLTGSDAGAWVSWVFGQQRPTLTDEAGTTYDTAAAKMAAGFLSYVVMNNPRYDWRRVDAEKDTAALDRRLGELLNADQTDLSRFVRRGGKLLIWHGWSDAAIPPEMSIDLYDRIFRDTHGAAAGERLEQSVRLFMVPGLEHCFGGPGLTQFDALSAMEGWVERGRAPDLLIAARGKAGEHVVTRPLCRYPQRARYRGSGSKDSADAFECRS